MNQLKLLTHIISTCDDALAETFQKRMSIAAMMAETRHDLNEEIFDEAAETAYVHSVAAQFVDGHVECVIPAEDFLEIRFFRETCFFYL